MIDGTTIAIHILTLVQDMTAAVATMAVATMAVATMAVVTMAVETAGGTAGAGIAAVAEVEEASAAVVAASGHHPLLILDGRADEIMVRQVPLSGDGERTV